MAFTAILPLLLLMQLATTLVVAELNGWNLDMACQPVGEVSKADFGYTGNANTDQAVSFILTADWGDDAKQYADVLMGGTEGEDQYGFTYMFEEAGTHELRFTVEFESGKVTVPKVCEITAATSTAATPEDENAAAEAVDGATSPKEPESSEKPREDSVQADSTSAGSSIMILSSYSVAFALFAQGFIMMSTCLSI